MKIVGTIFIAFVLYFGLMYYVGTVTGAAQASTALPLPALSTSGPPTLISMAGGRIAHSSTFQSQLIGDTFPHGMAGYQIRVSTLDPTIALVVQFLTPDFGLTNATSTADSITVGVVDLNGVVAIGAVEAVLGTVTFLGLSEGITPIVIEVLLVSDEAGTPVLTSTTVGLLTVSNSRDLDGDGLTEDINGNGFFDFADILELFLMLLKAL